MNIILMQTRMFMSPSDETVELAFAVESVHALAAEVLFFHLPDDADGLMPHGPESFDRNIRP